MAMIIMGRFIHLLPPEIQMIVRGYMPNIVECTMRIIMQHFTGVLEVDRAEGH